VTLDGGKVSAVNAVVLVGSLWHRRLRRHGDRLACQRRQHCAHVRMSGRLKRKQASLNTHTRMSGLCLHSPVQITVSTSNEHFVNILSVFHQQIASHIYVIK